MHRRMAGMGVTLALIGAVLLDSCEERPYHPNQRYVLVAANIQLPYWVEASAGLRDEASVLGVKAEMEGPDSYDPQQELADFQKVVATRPTGILVSPAQPQIFDSAIDAAIREGIPVITIDSDAPASRRILFIGTDNSVAGAQAGQHVASLLQGRGNVVIITIPGQLNLDERLLGAQQALSAYPRIKVIATLNDHGRPEDANDELSALIDKKKKIDGVLCLEASGGPGAAEVLHRLSLNGTIKIVAFDKTPETLDWISSGAISGTIAQKPYTMSYYGLMFLDDLHDNAVHLFRNWRTAPASPLPSNVDTGIAWVDSSNVTAFKAAVASYKQPFGSM
ncbi:MAG TPA: substrate-binding domain-containing protein [Terriglobia bacterium]|nr:substrate-binding domain-containing protein [Terriglobia bacterium]